MEEADILSDRIGIMARRKLRCIGTSVRLKSRFGSGFVINVSVKNERIGNNFLQDGSDSLQREGSGQRSEPVKHFFREHLNVEPKQENKAYVKFIIPREKEEQLMDFFANLQDREEELGISNIQLSLSTLQEVFFSIARQAEVETAAAEDA